MIKSDSKNLCRGRLEGNKIKHHLSKQIFGWLDQNLFFSPYFYSFLNCLHLICLLLSWNIHIQGDLVFVFFLMSGEEKIGCRKVLSKAYPSVSVAISWDPPMCIVEGLRIQRWRRHKSFNQIDSSPVEEIRLFLIQDAK